MQQWQFMEQFPLNCTSQVLYKGNNCPRPSDQGTYTTFLPSFAIQRENLATRIPI